MHFLAQRDAALERLADLGVRIRAGGEIAIGLGLLGHDRDIGDAHAVEDAADAFHARPVERRVYKLQGLGCGNVFRACNRKRFNGVDVAIEDVFAYPLHKPGGNRVVKGHALDAGKRVDLLDGGADSIRRLGCNLAAVGAVCLVAIVGRGIVARGHAHAAAALQVADGPRRGGHRLDAGIREHFHAVGGEHLGGTAHEILALVAAVAADCYARVLEVGVEVIGETLRSAPDRVDVHAVRARADDAAQSGGAELQILVEGLERGSLVLAHFRELSCQILFGHVGNPLLKQFGFPRHGLFLPFSVAR